MKHLKKNQKAFTIIELLIASTVFSMIILGACVAIIQMSRLYYKGIILSRTQTAGRNLTQSIAREIQFQGGDVTTDTVSLPPNTIQDLKIGATTYRYAKNKQQGSDIKHAILKFNNSLSPTPNPDLNTALGSSELRDVLANNMRVLNLDVEEFPSSIAPGVYKINVKIAYGDSDLFDDPDNPTMCKGNPAGSQWCSIVEYNTMVFQRKS